MSFTKQQIALKQPTRVVITPLTPTVGSEYSHRVMMNRVRYMQRNFGNQTLAKSGNIRRPHNLNAARNNITVSTAHLSIRRDPPKNGNNSDNRSNNVDEKIDKEIEKYVLTYQALFEKQSLALETLKETAGKEDPPPFWWNLAVAGVSVALAAATGGIGSAVAISVTDKLTKMGIPEFTIKIVADMAKDGTKAAIKEIPNLAASNVKNSAQEYPSDDKERAAKIFFNAQKEALIDAKLEAQLGMVEKKDELKRKGNEGLIAASVAATDVKRQFNSARNIQRKESIHQWAIYQAKMKLGQTGQKGTNLGIRSSGARGVLYLDGNWYDKKSIRLTDASMKGMNSPLRANIARTKIGQLKLPIVLRLEVGSELSWVDKYIGKRYPHNVAIRRNELGEFWVPPNDGNVELVIQAGGRPRSNMGASGDFYTVTTDQIFEAAEVTFEKIKSMKPPLE